MCISYVSKLYTFRKLCENYTPNKVGYISYVSELHKLCTKVVCLEKLCENHTQRKVVYISMYESSIRARLVP